MTVPIKGFSKLSKEEKIRWIALHHTSDPERTSALLKSYWNEDPVRQQLHDEFTENTLSNFYLPFGVAPNFLINGELYAVPMATEESSVVAAAGKAAKYWLHRGGFTTRVLGIEKTGHVHFIYEGDFKKLEQFIIEIKSTMLRDTSEITKSMEKRGGGVLDISLRDKNQQLANYRQLHCTFNTKDAMGANFINSCLEQFATTLKREVAADARFTEQEKAIEIVMSILSNYVPGCVVRAEVSCPVEQLNEDAAVSPADFASKIVQAVKIAGVEPYRAVTHNKGLMNGVDAVAVATGNDFRAVEAGIHAYASRNGSYQNLSFASVEDGQFTFWTEIPLALGTVGGITRLHPMVKLALEILGHPSAEQLMQITAAAGLAQNFGALRSLVTTGIQHGHMKMHLLNILNEFGATAMEKDALIHQFRKQTVTHSAVATAFQKIRGG